MVFLGLYDLGAWSPQLPRAHRYAGAVGSVSSPSAETSQGPQYLPPGVEGVVWSRLLPQSPGKLTDEENVKTLLIFKISLD